jgi:ubiquinone/menaquinone biosynthesis C-methylase UbiE
MTTTVFDESERRIWAGRADAYAASFAKLCAYAVPGLLDAAGVGTGNRVLGVGTGTGAVAGAAWERGARVVAVDADAGMVEVAAKAVPGAEVRVGELPELPFGEGEFDAVVGNFVINHVGRPPAAALAEMRRWCGRAGGTRASRPASRTSWSSGRRHSRSVTTRATGRRRVRAWIWMPGSL